MFVSFRNVPKQEAVVTVATAGVGVVVGVGVEVGMEVTAPCT